MALLVSLTDCLLLRHEGETGAGVNAPPAPATAFDIIITEAEPSCHDPAGDRHCSFSGTLPPRFEGRTSGSTFTFSSFRGPAALSENTFSTSSRAGTPLLHLARRARLVLRAGLLLRACLHLQAPCGQLTFKLPLQARPHSTGPRWSPGSSCPQLESL